MTTKTKCADWTDYDGMAEQAANNHESFDSFAWFNAPDDAAFWTLVYTHNRDSGSIDKANSEALAAILAEYIESGDVVSESHSHWAVGWVEGYAIRVYEGGEVTAAFKAYCDAQARLEDYPILDESLLGEIEQTEIDESWDIWIRSDFERAIEKAHDVELDDCSDEALRQLFDNACNESSTYPEHSGSEVIVCLETIVASVTLESLKPYVPAKVVRIFRDGYVLTTGLLHCGEYASYLRLYDAEFEACMEADDNGDSSVTIEGHEFTWTIE